MKKLLRRLDERGVLWATLNRPERRNAVDYDMMDEFEQLIHEIKHLPHVKALVITGAGDAFCAGGDLQQFHALRTTEEAYPMLQRMGTVLYDLMLLPVPTIALLNGTAVGGGCEIASACDYRFAAHTATVGFVQGNLAITTGWGGAAMLLEKVRHDEAMTLLCSARRFTAHDAKDLGFIQEVFLDDVMLSCDKWIEEMLIPRAEVLRAYKESAARRWEATGLRERMVQEIRQCAQLWEGEAHHEAVAAFFRR
ncbi:enoyl-CoA hydratase/isomerase family protein [Ectobacillus ponti]|uniref:Ethylmalonyl-CoA decarboxylase n=1 Tax=Ectobacillus ponti TaxID=2961894 RepID=A0AA42BQU2_9BACI|nr:enoyl-CoA hydratase/isomerase family protein [Ectobacillus ponti]MCP8970257.1 enoyl-CoA hydratase/isomerase family protein [Ectobacillus ponti]